MKTPREIILARHQAANPKLDELRRSTVAGLAKHQSTPVRPPILFLFKLWQELVWPCRRTWASLAIVWVAIMAFNLAHAQSRQTVIVTRPVLSGDMRLAYREQKQLLDELLAPATTAQAAPAMRSPDHRPRSEWRKPAQG